MPPATVTPMMALTMGSTATNTDRNTTRSRTSATVRPISSAWSDRALVGGLSVSTRLPPNCTSSPASTEFCDAATIWSKESGGTSSAASGNSTVE